MQKQISERVSHLRSWLQKNQLDALIIPHENEYLGEYLPAYHERLQWSTGFTGSAGVAIITQEHASIFVDGRYTVQVTKQAPSTLFEYHHLIEEPFLDWIIDHIPTGGKVGFDPRLHSATWLTEAEKHGGNSIQLCPVKQNPIDTFWSDKPQPKNAPIWLMDQKQSGQSSEDKRLAIAASLKDKAIQSAILTQPDAICWLLNIRGQDIPCLPVVLTYAIIHDDASIDLFIHSEQIIDGFNTHVGHGLKVYSPEHLENQLHTLRDKRVLLDPAGTNAWFALSLAQIGAHLILGTDPCLLPKATKNPHETAGMKSCHTRDGVAMVKFLSWLDQEVALGHLYDEAELSDQLQAFRQEDPTFFDLSFDTISAAGSNAAMCHYHHLNQPSPGKLMMNTLYLVDSGGQYTDGTTDITRTIAIGEISPLMKQQFTLVLKGHIALASARFPAGTTGHQLDALARQHLWAHGFDFDHGTGHGVGHCLNVHEGPQRISKAPNTVALRPGMVISNEPGYYREGHFGIRIENLELVVNIKTEGDFDVLGFESLTRCPIDLRAIDTAQLSEIEKQWLNSYHQKVWQEISPYFMDKSSNHEKTLAWLEHATRTIA